jgi:hypothetical protein
MSTTEKDIQLLRISGKDFPRVVTLCGSSRFMEQYQAAMKSETLAGRIAIGMGMFGHRDGLDMDGPIKAMLDELHLRKIDLADEVLVVNVGGYIGKSTLNEISYARQTGKPVRFLEDDQTGSLT